MKLNELLKNIRNASTIIFIVFTCAAQPSGIINRQKGIHYNHNSKRARSIMVIDLKKTDVDPEAVQRLMEFVFEDKNAADCLCERSAEGNYRVKALFRNQKPAEACEEALKGFSIVNSVTITRCKPRYPNQPVSEMLLES